MAQETNQSSTSPLQITLIAILALVLLGLALWGGQRLAESWVPAPKVGVIRMNYEIFSFSAAEMLEQLEYARNNEEIEAVVILINSPGGSAAYSEELFMDVLNTRDTLPVVASVDLLAASGAYYTAVGANEIYAKPTSFIGSVGVIASFPGPVFIDDEILTTGPYKLFGGTRDGVIQQVELAKFAFLDAVAVGRGDRLEISLDELSRAEIYSGVQALNFGMIDGFLSNDEVIARAAELAGLTDYEVVELLPLAFEELGTTAVYGDYQPPALDVERL